CLICKIRGYNIILFDFINIVLFFFFFFFFFQAEDGIRDLIVTGVQTCALPIYEDSPTSEQSAAGCGRKCVRWCSPGGGRIRGLRSEERRVGKECRSRWSAYD